MRLEMDLDKKKKIEMESFTNVMQNVGLHIDNKVGQIQTSMELAWEKLVTEWSQVSLPYGRSFYYCRIFQTILNYIPLYTSLSLLYSLTGHLWGEKRRGF